MITARGPETINIQSTCIYIHMALSFFTVGSSEILFESLVHLTSAHGNHIPEEIDGQLKEEEMWKAAPNRLMISLLDNTEDKLNY